jgi:diguanylate cyclase (GGDEF)-like protein
MRTVATLRRRIALLFCGLLTIVEVLTLIIVNSASYHAANTQIHDDLATAQRVFTQILSQDGTRLAQAGRALVHDYAFREAVSSEDPATIRSALENLGRRVNAAATMLVDPRGAILSDTFGKHDPGETARLEAYILESTTDNKSESITLVDGAAYHVVIAPVRAPITLGWVFLFFPVDDSLAQELRRLTDTDVTFLARKDGNWSSLATTLSVEDSRQLGRLMAPAGLSEVDSRVELSQGATIAKTFPITQDGSVQLLATISRPLGPALASFQKFERLLILLGVAAMACSVIFGILIANGIVNPLDRLRRSMSLIEDGNYDVPIKPERMDEIGAVAAGMDHMRLGIREHEHKILTLAYTDSLTGLPNRTRFNDELERQANIAQSAGHSFCMIALRLERFRQINNVLGHAGGDAVLLQLSQRLRRFINGHFKAPQRHMLAHLNGSEFAILLGDRSTIDDAVRAARSIRQTLNEPFICDGQPVDVRVNMGIAEFPLHASDHHALIRSASLALSAAKESTSDFVVFDPVNQNAQQEHLSLLGELQRAMSRQELELHYQPKLDLGTGDVRTVEALIRWKDPVRGWVPPSMFIPFAEETGYIKILTQWVINEAIRQTADWRTRNVNVEVAVNLSASDLMNPELPDFVAGRLAKYEVGADSLRFELTEGGFLRNPEIAKNTLEKLASAGHGLSIDDYGTGYSSLSYLRELPVDELKLDRSFISNLASDESLATIVRSTVEMCHGLGLTIVAEGVESEDVRSRLQRLNCDSIQGFLISPALTGRNFEKWLSTLDKPAAPAGVAPLFQMSG